MSYLSLFLISFLAGSFVPLGSEAFLVALRLKGADLLFPLIIATSGNTLGGITCYLIGKWGGRGALLKYLKMPAEKLEHWSKKINHKGDILCFFAFAPFIGEFLVAAAGVLQRPLWKIALYSALGKGLRYAFILYF